MRAIVHDDKFTVWIVLPQKILDGLCDKRTAIGRGHDTAHERWVCARLGTATLSCLMGCSGGVHSIEGAIGSEERRFGHTLPALGIEIVTTGKRPAIAGVT